ncbi:hypothetical protein CYLTODRAFT_418982 [Cylindrobasidium torrendii FP15055 ss-10]|uniref:Homeobox domain-containing protein n=1 Tax=Cylindrobasidium torrendii FP15055 ss-10 TaxID=1314674 RepID=A0A0D7BM73_9AGAR|nr:hypothetical protein CYLTODRAFT_418982 [Cylindrobasidium torrendii FP15055 ss-10]
MFLACTRHLQRTVPLRTQIRSVFTLREKRAAFFAVFAKNHYPTREFEQKLAHDLDVPESRMHAWYLKARYQANRDNARNRMTLPVAYGQEAVLEQAFAEDPYVCANPEKIAIIQEATGETRQRLENWFRYRRRKHGIKLTEPQQPARPTKRRSTAKANQLPVDHMALYEEIFVLFPWPSQRQLAILAELTPGTPQQRIQDWFLRRRHNERRYPARPASPILDPLQTVPGRVSGREASLKALLEMYPDVIHGDFPCPGFWTQDDMLSVPEITETTFSKEHRALLEETFAICPWPSKTQMEALLELMPKFGIESVKSWFMRRRYKERVSSVNPTTPILEAIRSAKTRRAGREGALKALKTTFPDVIQLGYPSRKFWECEQTLDILRDA